MHNFGRNDALFNTVKFVLNDILSLRTPTPHEFTLDEKGMKSFSTGFLSRILTYPKDCLQSLSFPEMEEREYDVANATKNTCTWLSKDPVYMKWLSQKHGLLWIKGHPGVGKSTLMKHAFKAMIKEENTIVISFFFHARGTSLQHSILGLFRSLLHQLFKRIPNMLRKITDLYLRKCETQGEHGKGWEWNQHQLQELFISHVLKASELYTIRIYIDALDECGEEAAVDLIKIFQEVADSSSLCFSCRHYPLIALENGLEINVEANNADDIKIYVSHQLDEQESVTESFRDQIIKKASGNFQWVKIVARLVSDFCRKRYSRTSIQAQIAAIPVKLSELYEDLLTSIDEWEKPESLQLMQWIIFALRPLSLSELRFAMVVDADTACHSINQCQESEQYMETDKDMDIRVRHLSKGLAEVISHGGKPIVQLIHQSVNDFLIEKKGLELLYGSQDRASADSLTGRAHFRLSRSCIKYLSMRELHNWKSHNEGLPHDWVGSGYFENDFPFVRYATKSWIPHAEIVEKENISQDDLHLYFQSPSVLQSWIYAYHCLDSWPFPPFSKYTNTTIAHIAAAYGFLSVLSAEHNHDFKVDFTDGELLKRAAQNGQMAIVNFLVERDDVDADFRDEKGRTPLSWAAGNGHEAIVELLLNRNDVRPDSKDKNGRTPLSYAAEKWHDTIAKLLMARHDGRADLSRFYYEMMLRTIRGLYR